MILSGWDAEEPESSPDSLWMLQAYPTSSLDAGYELRYVVCG